MKEINAKSILIIFNCQARSLDYGEHMRNLYSMQLVKEISIDHQLYQRMK